MKRYGPYKSNYGHLFYIDIDQNGNRKSIWAHKEIVENKLGRKLSKNEVVHHINGDKTNNHLYNLEIKNDLDHRAEHARKPRAEVYNTYVCQFCGKSFERLIRQEKHNRKQHKSGPFCGKSCAGKWSREKQLGRI